VPGTPPTSPGWLIVAQALTDGAGRYHVDDLAAGRYTLRFEDQFDALVGKVRHQPAFLGGADVLSGARLVDVAGGGAVVVADQQLDLSPNERLLGSVREDRAPGYPIKDVSVRVFVGGELTRQTFTDGNGRFDVGGLRPGEYVVAFLDELPRNGGPFGSAWATAGAVVVRAGADRVLDQLLTRAG
jgi:hypothetical protein